MKRRIVVCGLLLSGALAAAQQAEIRGKVQLMKNGHRFRDAGKAVVWLTPLGNTPVEPSPPQKPSEIPKLIQKDKSFHPSLVVVPVGGKVEFPNHDPFFHNVFSLYDGKRFDLGLYESGSTQFVRFDKPGISYIFCNIHAQMSAVVIALNTPYYALSDAHGAIDIRDIVPGRYQMHIFHASVPQDTLRTQEREITVAAGQTTLGTITLEESNLEVAHKNKYGRDYDPPEPDNPAYVRP
ncbi:MAG TPA: hypothetical protein VMU61_11555 [Candidatus Aquilonibacter sp.]|nr:hypothetical protein [Candidatus Aquilonibacter sp.]